MRFYTSPSRLEPSVEKRELERTGIPRTWYGCLNPKDIEYKAISFRYALALFCLIFAKRSDLGSYRSFRQHFKDALDASGTTGFHRSGCAFVWYVSIVSGCGVSSFTRYTASLQFSHIQVTGLPKTALPQDVRRLVQTRNLENVSGSESVDSCS